jgi:hypothetical protein
MKKSGEHQMPFAPGRCYENIKMLFCRKQSGEMNIPLLSFQILLAFNTTYGQNAFVCAGEMKVFKVLGEKPFRVRRFIHPNNIDGTVVICRSDALFADPLPARPEGKLPASAYTRLRREKNGKVIFLTLEPLPRILALNSASEFNAAANPSSPSGKKDKSNVAIKARELLSSVI